MAVVDTDNFVIPSDPEVRKHILGCMKEISNSLTRKEGEQDHINEILGELEEKTGIKKKHFRKMAKDYHKDSFDKTSNENDNYEALYETVFKASNNDVVEEVNE